MAHKKFNPRQILNSDDRFHKSRDSKHIEGFHCSACKYQCRNCHKFAHFSSLCYKKQDSYKKRPRSPKAHQLRVGQVYMQENSICSQLSDNTSSDESFCLQMKLQVKQANTNTKYSAPQHLFTDLEFKVKPHRNKTKFLQARIDTCADVNIIPVSIYKYLFKDPDCVKIAPSNLQLSPYTNNKVMILGFCNLYVMHPDTRCIKKNYIFLWPAIKAVS